MARVKLQSERVVVERCRELRQEVQDALARLPVGADDPGVVDAVWHGEALGTLLWALQLAELPPYDRPFDPAAVTGSDVAEGKLRDADDVDLERESARLWHWRARTAELRATRPVELPSHYASSTSSSRRPRCAATTTACCRRRRAATSVPTGAATGT